MYLWHFNRKRESAFESIFFISAHKEKKRPFDRGRRPRPEPAPPPLLDLGGTWAPSDAHEVRQTSLRGACPNQIVRIARVRQEPQVYGACGILG
jgi:hypothetical protein